MFSEIHIHRWCPSQAIHGNQLRAVATSPGSHRLSSGRAGMWSMSVWLQMGPLLTLLLLRGLISRWHHLSTGRLGGSTRLYYWSVLQSTGTPHWRALCLTAFRVCRKLQFLKNAKSGKPFSATFPTAFAHCVFVYHILVIVFQIFLYYSCSGDLWWWLAENSDDG